MNVLQGAVFLDRDGTLNEEIGYLHRVEDFCWIPGAREAILALNQAGLVTIVVTNQAGIARGYFDEQAVHRLHAYMSESLREIDARIDAFYFCPFHPEATREAYRCHSPYRKPGTGMFEQAREDWSIDVEHSYVIGDSNTDIVPGRKLGMTTILVSTGYGSAERAETAADYVVKDVGAAVAVVLRQQALRASRS